MPSRHPSATATTGLAPVPPAGTNLVVVRGVLSRHPEVRALPSGDAVATYEVTVRPVVDAAPGRAESVPVCWFRPPSGASSLAAGDEVVVVGRVRRRFFRAGEATASRTEVVAESVVRARAASRCRSAVAAGLSALLER